MATSLKERFFSIFKARKRARTNSASSSPSRTNTHGPSAQLQTDDAASAGTVVVDTPLPTTSAVVHSAPSTFASTTGNPPLPQQAQQGASYSRTQNASPVVTSATRKFRRRGSPCKALCLKTPDHVVAGALSPLEKFYQIYLSGQEKSCTITTSWCPARTSDDGVGLLPLATDQHLTDMSGQSAELSAKEMGLGTTNTNTTNTTSTTTTTTTLECSDSPLCLDLLENSTELQPLSRECTLDASLDSLDDAAVSAAIATDNNVVVGQELVLARSSSGAPATSGGSGCCQRIDFVEEEDQGRSFLQSGDLEGAAVATTCPVDQHGLSESPPEVDRGQPAGIHDQVEEDEMVSDVTGLVDVFSLKLKATMDSERKALGKLFNTHRKRQMKMERAQREMEQLGRELEEMRRQLEHVQRQRDSIQREAADVRTALTAVCDLTVATVGRETQAQRLEPTCYRRYQNIKTAADAVSVLNAVRSRQKALSELAVLIYRKQLVLHHSLPSTQLEKVNKKTNRLVKKPICTRPVPTDQSTLHSAHHSGKPITLEIVPSTDMENGSPSWSSEASNSDTPPTLTTPTPLSQSSNGTTESPRRLLFDSEV